MSQLILQYGARVLFQGDSITDAGRDRGNEASLGGGYAGMIAAWLTARYPGRKLTFLNRGISGNRVPDLDARWSADCLDIQPDWLSLLIGINDTFSRVRGNDPTPVKAYEDGCRRLLDRVKEETDAGIILLEPFLLPSNEDLRPFRAMLDEHVDAIRRVARDYNTLYIPLDGLFAAAATQMVPEDWAYDGVHPTAAGHAFIAQAWIRTVEIGAFHI